MKSTEIPVLHGLATPAKTVPCDLCDLVVAAESAVHSTASWKLLCPSCLVAEKRTAKRKMLGWISIGVAAFAIMTIGMFAAGLAKNVGSVLFGLGVAIALGSSMLWRLTLRRRNQWGILNPIVGFESYDKEDPDAVDMRRVVGFLILFGVGTAVLGAIILFVAEHQ